MNLIRVIKHHLRGVFIFLLCECFCFGALEYISKSHLEGNLQKLHVYSNDYMVASSIVLILLPIIIAAFIYFTIWFYYKKEKAHIFLILTVLLVLDIYIFYSMMEDNAGTFLFTFLGYFGPLMALWLGVYILHDIVDWKLPKIKA